MVSLARPFRADLQPVVGQVFEQLALTRLVAVEFPVNTDPLPLDGARLALATLFRAPQDLLSTIEYD
jgi:hypothetical protein